MATRKPASNSNYYVVIGLITALVIVVTVFFAQSLFHTALHNTRVNTALNRANTQLTSDLTAANTLVSAYNSLGDTKQLIANALPSTGDYPGLTALLENAGAATSVTVKSVSPNQSNQLVATSSASAGAQTINFSSTVTGTYTAVLAFLNALQQSVRPIQVSSLQINGTGSAITAQVNGQAYYQGSAQLPFKTDYIK